MDTGTVRAGCHEPGRPVVGQGLRLSVCRPHVFGTEFGYPESTTGTVLMVGECSTGLHLFDLGLQSFEALPHSLHVRPIGLQQEGTARANTLMHPPRPEAILVHSPANTRLHTVQHWGSSHEFVVPPTAQGYLGTDLCDGPQNTLRSGCHLWSGCPVDRQCTGQMVGHALADLVANTDVPRTGGQWTGPKSARKSTGPRVSDGD